MSCVSNILNQGHMAHVYRGETIAFCAAVFGLALYATNEVRKEARKWSSTFKLHMRLHSDKRYLQPLQQGREDGGGGILPSRSSLFSRMNIGRSCA